MTIDEIGAVLNRVQTAQMLPTWHRTGGSEFMARPVAGNAVAVLGYDGTSTDCDSPRWRVTVWESAIAYELRDRGKRLAVVFFNGRGLPFGSDTDEAEQLAEFACAALRMVPSIESYAASA